MFGKRDCGSLKRGSGSSIPSKPPPTIDVSSPPQQRPSSSNDQPSETGETWIPPFADQWNGFDVSTENLDERPSCKVSITGKEITGLLDSGSMVTFIRLDAMKAKIERDPTRYASFRIEGNRLLKYESVQDDIGCYSYAWKEYVPRRHRTGLINELHQRLCHLGVSKCAAVLCKAFFFPQLHSTVRRQLWTCETCKVSKPWNQDNHVPMGESRVAWETIRMKYGTLIPRQLLNFTLMTYIRMPEVSVTLAPSHVVPLFLLLLYELHRPNGFVPLSYSNTYSLYTIRYRWISNKSYGPPSHWRQRKRNNSSSSSENLRKMFWYSKRTKVGRMKWKSDAGQLKPGTRRIFASSCVVCKRRNELANVIVVDSGAIMSSAAETLVWNVAGPLPKGCHM